jgi:ribonuclease Z
MIQARRRKRHVLACALLLLAASAVQAQDIKVTLLGTGTPVPAMHRFGPSTLVEAGGQRFLFDAGRGALQRLAQVGVRWQDVDAVFLTHLHSDHVVGLPDLWLSGWLVAPGRNRPLRVLGPQGTAAMMDHLREAFAFDIAFRQSDDRASPEGVVVEARDLAPGIVFEHDGVTITAFEVDHAPVRPAFGYRVDFRGRSVVLSGDTRVSENLVRHARGADLLIHEVASPASFRRMGVNAERAATVVAHHTTPEQAGEVFSRVKPRLAVYSHIVQPGATRDELVVPTRTTYAGPLEVGEDLMVIEVGATVDVRRPAPGQRE